MASFAGSFSNSSAALVHLFDLLGASSTGAGRTNGSAVGSTSLRTSTKRQLKKDQLAAPGRPTEPVVAPQGVAAWDSLHLAFRHHIAPVEVQRTYIMASD